MARLLSPPAIPPVLRRTAANAVPSERVAPRASASASIDIAQIWRESLQTFSTHSVAMLLCILSGLMSPFLVGHWIATQVVLQDMDWVGPVPALQEKLSLNTLAVLACAGWLTTSLARGVIASLALQGNAGNAIRETLVRLPVLLIGFLAYSAVIAVGLLGISPIAQNSSAFGQAANLPTFPTRSKWEKTMSKTGQQIADGALTVFLSDAGAPFSIVLPEIEAALLRRPQVSAYETYLADIRSYVTQEPPVIERIRTIHPDAWTVISVASFALLFLSETLLRFRVVMAFEPLERIAASNKKQGGYSLQRFAALSPLIESVRFGWRYFGIITLHVWVLRIAGGALVLLLVKLPMAAALHIALPALTELIGKTPLPPVLSFVQLGLAAFVAAIVLAFNTLYDARLFMALRIHQK